MRLVFLGDIQGNLPALDAVLQEVDKRPCDAVFHVGNAVGLGPFPGEVLARLRERRIAGVRGDLDDRVGHGPISPLRRGEDTGLYEAACAWTRSRLTRRDLNELVRLPFTRVTSSSSMSVSIFHAHPVTIDQPVHERLGDDRFREVGAYTGAQVNVFAHTCRPFWRVVDGRWYINAGAVGCSEGEDARATYAVVEINGGAAVRHHAVDYDRDATAAAVREGGLPGGVLRLLGVA